MPTTIKAKPGRTIPRDMREWSVFFEQLKADHLKAGQTDYDTGIGFFLGDHNGTPKLSIGNSAGNKVTWDGTTLTIVGTITATTGTIGGWTLAATYLSSGTGANTVRLDSAGTNPAISAGSATPGSAPFRVTQAGDLVATSATITGAITATSGSFTGTVTSTAGTIGGWTLSATALTAGSGATTVGIDSAGTNPAFYAGSATPASAPFRVTQAGALVATSATITGAVTATSGSFTGAITATSGSFTGGVTVGSGGALSSGQTAYDTGTGFWFEYNSGTPRMSLGNASGNKLKWDGSLLTVAGQVEFDNVQTFTPTWGGFSTDPTGDVSYINLGSLVMMWPNNTDNSFNGTSDDTVFTMHGIPAAIRPTNNILGTTAMVFDNDTPGGSMARAAILNTGQVTFYLLTLNGSGSKLQTVNGVWANTGAKGWFGALVYPLY